MDIENILYIVIAVIVSATIAIFQYYKHLKNKEKVSYLLTFLRFIALFTLLLLLINPTIEQNVVTVEKPSLVVAIDNSSSIKTTNQTNLILNLIKNLKSDKDLNTKFNVMYYPFGDGVTFVDSLLFNKSQTNISKSIQELEAGYKDKIAPIILITDGNQTVGQDYEYVNYKQSIFPIVVGDTTRYIDLSIHRLNTNKYVFLDNKFPVEVFLNYEGKQNSTTRFSVIEKGEVLFSKRIKFSEEESYKNLNFYLSAKKVGVHYFTAQLSKLDNEKNTLNNKKEFVVEVVDEQASVLILTSFLHPDIGALKKAIESNKQRSVTIKKISENYDISKYQMVILYQPTKAFSAIFSELKFNKINHFIITGTKTDWSFLNKIQDAFEKSWIQQIENYTPVYNQNFNPFTVRDIGFESLPPIDDQFGAIRFKVPFESLLTQKVGRKYIENPLLATYELEGVRSAVLFGENSWRWRMISKSDTNTFADYDNFIGSLLQYLVSSKKGKHLQVSYETIYFENDKIEMTAQYFDENYQQNTHATLWLELKNKQTDEIKRLPFSYQNNLYVINLSGLSAGAYFFTISVENTSEVSKGNFKIVDFDVEKQFYSSNKKKLLLLANKTGGTLHYLDSSKSITTNLLHDERFVAVQKSEKKQKPIIDWQWLLVVIVVSLSIEWFVRKYNGFI